MGRKKEDTPTNIKRYTIQMDEAVYRAIKRSAIGIKKKNNLSEDVKTYELMNKIILLGIEVWSKLHKDPKVTISLKDDTFVKALAMAKLVP